VVELAPHDACRDCDVRGQRGYDLSDQRHPACGGARGGSCGQDRTRVVHGRYAEGDDGAGGDLRDPPATGRHVACVHHAAAGGGRGCRRDQAHHGLSARSGAPGGSCRTSRVGDRLTVLPVSLRDGFGESAAVWMRQGGQTLLSHPDPSGPTTPNRHRPRLTGSSAEHLGHAVGASDSGARRNSVVSR
jgi:hypothetical protein